MSATILTRATCEACGAFFNAEARECEGGQPDERLVELLARDCPACTELGEKPPTCPCDYGLPRPTRFTCGGALRGAGGEHGDPWFACDGCDTEFSVATVRELLVGRALIALLKERKDDADVAAFRRAVLAIGARYEVS